MKSSPLFSKIVLPSGAHIANRFVKSAMSENMAHGHAPGPEFYNLYKKWAAGGLGLCISGNVMVDSRHLGEAHNIVIEKGNESLDELKKWNSSKEGTEMKIWVQLNHPGKQTPKFLCREPVAPSAIPLQKPLDKLFNTPRELSEVEICEIIERFAYAALICKKAGFDGVQIHGAHGYLVSQFLSPAHNKRKDQWGGSLENRMRFVKEIYVAMRKSVGEKFPIGIKINTADFQKGGFTPEDSLEVSRVLSQMGIDLIEISGGSYEKPTMMGSSTKESTRKREAYFLEYARAIKKEISCPLMVTGGFRTLAVMEEALKNGELDLIGLARPLAVFPDLVKSFMSQSISDCHLKPVTTGFSGVDALFPLEILWYSYQLHRLGKNRAANPRMSPWSVILRVLAASGIQSLKRVRA